ncbi:MAG: hypothetical protein RIT27_329 [Pseudomonadota bacterium]|jgi:hypothetical protein
MRQFAVSALVIALGLPMVGHANEQAAAPQQPAAAPVAPAAPEAPKAPDFDAMEKEHADFMKSKHERMAKIWGTNDPNERQKLIDEDRKIMQAHREKMRALSGMPAMPARGGWGRDMDAEMPPMGEEMPPMRGGAPYPMSRPPMPPMMGMGRGGHHQDVLERLDRIEKTLNEMAGKKAQ